jgi:hypothetical protein
MDGGEREIVHSQTVRGIVSSILVSDNVCIRSLDHHFMLWEGRGILRDSGCKLTEVP